MRASDSHAALRDLIESTGAQAVSEYESYRVVYVSSAQLAAFVTKARSLGLQPEIRDDFDVISLPGAVIDVRDGVSAAIPPSVRILAYPGGVTGLHVIQFIAPPHEAWIREVERRGVRLLQYVPWNAYIAVAESSRARALGDLSFVQWVSPYEPFSKAGGVARGANLPTDVRVAIANVVNHHTSVNKVASLSTTDLRSESYDYMLLLHTRLDPRSMAELLRDPLVIGLHAIPDERLSDERQAIATTTKLSTDETMPNPFPMPNPATGHRYTDWLSATCSNCASLPSDFKIGIADTGVDRGIQDSNSHPDLSGRVEWGANYTSEVAADRNGHGTMVAGVAAGNGGTGVVDGHNFLNGIGLAPTGRIRSTKIANYLGVFVTTSNITQWAHDARANGVYIQNHSHNDYGARCGGCAEGRGGDYTLESRRFDSAVRDSNDTSSDGLTPITLTVSGGNIHDVDPSWPDRNLVLPPATAKNVIAMGASENYRPDQNTVGCRGTLADSFKNLTSTSKRQTDVSGFFKPDLVAPGSMIVSAKSQYENRPFCVEYFGGSNYYMMDSGTSFAAPAAAGAALLASRVYSTSPSAASPALLKAMLIGSAINIKDGTDRLDGSLHGWRPNYDIGFGRLHLNEVLSSTPSRQYINETVTFTSSGTTWSQTYTVNDMNKPVRIVLVWTDAPAAADATGSTLVNDLDLKVYETSCLWYVGNVMNSVTGYSQRGDCSVGPGHDHLNNVELVHFLPTQSSFQVNVRSYLIAGKAKPNLSGNNQDFALYLYNAQ